MAKKKRKTSKARPKRRAVIKARKPMATKAPKKRKSSKRAAPKRRRSSGGRRRDILGTLMPVLMASAGFVVAELVLPKVLASQSAKTRALVALGGGLALPMFMPSLAPVALGIGAQGAVTLARDLVLPALNGGRGVRGLSTKDRLALQRLAGGDSAMVNGDGRFVNGVPGQGPAAAMVNGADPQDRSAYV